MADHSQLLVEPDALREHDGARRRASTRQADVRGGSASLIVTCTAAAQAGVCTRDAQIDVESLFDSPERRSRGSNMLELRTVTKRYSSITVVDDVSFIARPGEITGY